MKTSLRALSLLALAVPVWASLSACGRPVRDNVVIVVVDTLRRDHLATYGYARQTAPFLDHLAQEGAVFDGLSPTSWTKPATASLLSGLHPLVHQAVGRLDSLPEAVETLPERLRAAGYATLGVSANGWISAPFGFDQGFDKLLDEDSVEHAEDVNRALLPRLDGLKPPFFLYVHYIDPHAPYDPRTAWDGGALREPGPVTMESLDPFTVRHRPQTLLARVRDLYDGEIRGADRGLEQLVNELARRGLMRNTILMVTSDHGEELEDHGRMSHGLSLYEEVVRVPLVIHAPHRFPAGRRGPASLLDVVPTLAEILDLPPVEGQPEADGVSLTARLHGDPPSGTPRPFFFHLDHMDGMGLALTHGRDKIVLGRSPYRKEVFDLAADPGETRNLLQHGGTQTFARLSGELAGLYNDRSQRSLVREPMVMTEKLWGALAAFGYASPGRRGDPRRIPRRIERADLDAVGLLGWEGSRTLPGCVQIGAPQDERHLLLGWNGPENGGRWSQRNGVLLLGAPEAGRLASLVVSGVSFRPDTPRVTVSLGRQPLLQTLAPPGEIRWRVPLPRHLRPGPQLVEIATDPVFIPAEHGAADARPLGLFLSSVCLESADAR